MVVYISGKITGEPLQQCKEKFAKAEKELQFLGVRTVNPFKLGCQDNWSFEQCRPFNFKAIACCNAIYCLSDCTESPGALEEIAEAQRRGLDVYYEDEIGYYKIRRALKSLLF